MPEFRAPVGTRDVVPPESGRWVQLVATFADLVGRAGYGLVVSPMFEDIGVFERLGASTDVVRKEMYDFRDKSDRHLALRPDGTASVVRAYLEQRPPTPWKCWYVAPSFRYERPQAGRYRQHHQLGIEVVGTDDPDIDVEVIALLDTLYGAVGLQTRTLLLNSLGDAASRPAYLAALRDYLDAHVSTLSEQSRATMELNPLRVLDSKRPEDAEVIATAPVMIDHLSEESAAHFARVQRGLESLGIEYVINPRLVRGLDYYTRTTFEFASDALDRPRTRSGAGGGTTGLPNSSAVRRLPASASAPAWNGFCWPAMPKASLARRSRRSTSGSSTPRAARPRSPSRTSSGRRASALTGRSTVGR